MSRTKKGQKAPGWETWSKRPYSCAPPGKKTKKITHKKERAANREEVSKRNKNMDKDMDEALNYSDDLETEE